MVLNDQYAYEEAPPEKQERVHFQTIYGQVSNGKFSATIPGKATNTYYGNRGAYNNKKLIGFATTRRATKAKYLLAETYDNILDDATYQSYGGYTLKLFPVFESSGGGGSENNHNFIFNMDDRFGEFKPGKNFVYNANTDDKDFIIPTEDDMKLQNKTNNWESDWMLWGWSKIQHGYHLGEKAFSLVTGNEEDVTLENVNLLNNSAYYSNSSNDDFAEKFKNPFETNKIISEFVAFKDDQIETTEDVNFYPLFVKRPKLRFEIRDGIEYNNKWKNSAGENLATIKKDGNNVQYVEFNYGDPDTTFPELEYDTDRFITFHTNWSNYWFDNDYNRLVTDKQRRLPTIRRGNNLEKIIVMWQTQTYEDEKFPISDQYNNVAWLSISLDLAKVFTDNEGYDEASFRPTSEKLFTDKFFSYYPVIFDKKNIITLKIDKNAEGHKYATIQDGLPWREEITLLEVRRTEPLNTVYTDTYDSFYYYEEYGREGDEIYYVDDSTVSFEMDSFGRHAKLYNYKYYAFKEFDPGTWYYNDHVYDDPYILAYDANGDTAYVGSGLIWDLVNEDKVRYSSDENILENFDKGKINPNGILTMSMYWEPTETEPKWKFIDATTKEVLSTQVRSSYRYYVDFAATASETKNRIMTYGAEYYKETNAWATDQSNGVTDVSVADVKIEDAAIKDDKIILVKPVIEVYLNRNSVDYPRIIFDVDKNGIASPSVSGPTSYISIKDKSEVVPPTVTSTDEEYVFETWVDSGNTPYTTEEIQNKFEEWKNNSPTDDLYFYPKFKKEKVLRFIIDSECATVEPSAKIKFYSKDYSTVVAPPFTEKVGYQFEKWVDKDGNSVTPSDWDGTYDIDIYAKFRTLKKFIFVVDDNYYDSSRVVAGDPVQREFDESSPLITPPNVYPKYGYDGANKGGFAKKQDAKVDEIMTDIEVKDFINDWQSSTTKEDVTLYYIFVEDNNIDKIKFEVDSSKGEFIGSSVYFIDPSVFDAEKTNILVNPKSGYMFTGWVNADDQNDKYMKAEEIAWDGTYTVTYNATFTTITPNPTPTPNPNNNNNPSNNNSGSTSGGGSDSSGSTTPPAGYNPNTNNPQQNKQPEMSAEEKLANPPDSKFIIVNMNKYNPSYKDNDASHSNDSGQNFLWETTDRVIWRLIQMDNIIENIDYRKTPEWDVVKSFFTQNCKFYDDGWCFLQYRGTNEWYHFAPNNIMDVGWFNKNGNWYYLQTDYNTTFGSMYTGIRDIDGVRYSFDKTGKLLGIVGVVGQFSN